MEFLPQKIFGKMRFTLVVFIAIFIAFFAGLSVASVWLIVQ